MGISSSLAWYGFAKQSAKGTAASAPVARAKFAGAASIALFKNRNEYPATDAARGPGNHYTSLMGVAGDVPFLVEPTFVASLLYYAMGAVANTGSADPWTHTITPASDIPYFTFWRMLGNVVNEKYQDCKVNRLELSGTAGSHFSGTLGLTGISSVWDTSPPSSPALTDPAGYLFPEMKDTFKIDTVPQRIHNFTLSIDNSLSPYQADDYIYTDLDVGKQPISMTFETRFGGALAFPDYRAFFYGSDAGTTMSNVVGTHAADVTLTRSASRSLQILAPQLTYSGIGIGAGDPGGTPINVPITAMVETPPSGDYLSFVVKDGLATVG